MPVCVLQDEQDVEKLAASKVLKGKELHEREGVEKMEVDGDRMEEEDGKDIKIEGEIVPTHTVERGTQSSFYTQLDKLSLEVST